MLGVHPVIVKWWKTVHEKYRFKGSKTWGGLQGMRTTG